MDPTDLANLIAQRKWVALAAVVIGLIVRLLKSDTKIPVDVPPQLRVWLALALGAASGALDKLVEAGNTTWTTALLNGLVAAVLAIVSHNLVIDSVRGGKELVVPGLIKPGVSPSPGNPPSIPPTSIAGILLVGACMALGVSQQGCALFTPANIAKAEVIAAKTADCLVEKQDLPDEQAFLECGVEAAERLIATNHLHAVRAETTRHAHAAANIAAFEAKVGCAHDGGPK